MSPSVTLRSLGHDFNLLYCSLGLIVSPYGGSVLYVIQRAICPAPVQLQLCRKA